MISLPPDTGLWLVLWALVLTPVLLGIIMFRR